MRIDVIVPVLNEEACIGGQLQSLSSVDGLHEVIVVDGGSTNGTVDLVKTAPDVRLVFARRGRRLATFFSSFMPMFICPKTRHAGSAKSSRTRR